MVIDVYAQSVLLLTQQIETNYKVVSAESQLVLHDSVQINMTFEQARSILYLTQSVKLAKTISVGASNHLTLVQSAQPRVHIVEASSFLALTHEAKHEDKWPSVRQALTLTQHAEAVVAHGTYDFLDLQQEATFTITRNVSVGNALTLKSEARVYKPTQYFIADPSLTVEAP